MNSFVIDRHCDDTYNYFDLIRIIESTPQEALLTCHIKSILNNELSSSIDNDFWVEELDQCEFYTIIGNFGKLKVVNQNNQKCVVKENFKNLSVLLEVELYKKSQSTDPIVLPIYMFQNHLFVFSVFELKTLACDVRSLLKKKSLSIYQHAYLIFNLLKGIEFLHNNKIIHRNITAENVFVFGNQVKIGNFSQAVLKKANKYSLDCDKIFPYCSPDYFCTEPKVTFKTDVWAIGTFACELWTQTPGTPFLQDGCPGTTATQEQMLNLKPFSNLIIISDTTGIVISAIQQNFLELCLETNYMLRPKVENLFHHSALSQKNVLFC